MSLTIIVNDSFGLSGELVELIKHCNKIKPKYLVINSRNEDVCDFFITHWRNAIFTRHKFDTVDKLLFKITPNIATQFFCCLDSVDPQINYEQLKLIITNFKESNKRQGMLVNPVNPENYCSPNKISSATSILNRNILLYNRSQFDDGYHYMVSTLLNKPYFPKIKLINKTVLITGVMGGIGIKTAEKYKLEGWSVIGLDLISGGNKRYLDDYYSLDLSKSAKVIGKKMNEILEKYPKIDNLVHVAGLQINRSIEKTKSEQLNKIMKVNLESIYTISQKIFPALKKTLGSMVIINSIHAFQSSENISAYAISKAALLGLTRNFAIEWGKHGINVNGIAPGAVNTPMLMNGLGRRGDQVDLALRKLEERHIMGRIGEPEEIAQLVWNLGTGPKLVNGQTLVADGGASILLSTEVS